MPLFLHSKMFIILKLDESDQISFMHLVSTLPLVTLMSSLHAKSPPKKKINKNLHHLEVTADTATFIFL